MTLSGPHTHPTQTHTAQPSTVLNAAHPDREKPAMTQAQDLLQFNSQSQLLGKKPSQNICEHHFLKTAWECLSKAQLIGNLIHKWNITEAFIKGIVTSSHPGCTWLSNAISQTICMYFTRWLIRTNLHDLTRMILYDICDVSGRG